MTLNRLKRNFDVAKEQISEFKESNKIIKTEAQRGKEDEGKSLPEL